MKASAGSLKVIGVLQAISRAFLRSRLANSDKKRLAKSSIEVKLPWWRRAHLAASLIRKGVMISSMSSGVSMISDWRYRWSRSRNTCGFSRSSPLKGRGARGWFSEDIADLAWRSKYCKILSSCVSDGCGSGLAELVMPMFAELVVEDLTEVPKFEVLGVAASLFVVTLGRAA